MATGGRRIKGITIEIGGETTGLQKALADVNKRSKDLQTELKDVDRLLKFDPGNTEAIAQKQKLLAEQVGTTTERLEMLRKAEQQVQDQVKKGEISEKQYRDFRREIEFTEGSLKNLKQQLSKVNDGAPLKDLKKDADNAQKSVEGLGGELAGLAGGLAAGGGIAGAVAGALDASSLKTQIDVSFNVPEESKKTVKEAIKAVESYGVDATEALEGVRRQWALNKDASDESNKAVIDGASTIAATYSMIDFTELIQESNEIANEMKLSQDNALGLVNALLKVGFPPEQLDIIAEYGGQLERAGYDAEEIQAIMATGVETGTWNIDNLLDGLKEGRIRVAEFGFIVPDAISDIIDGTDLSAEQFMKWGEAVAKGGEGGSKAMSDIAAALNNVEDETKKNALGVEVFGTIYEDQGQNIIDTLLNAKGATVDLKDGQEELNEATERLNDDPAIKLSQAMTDLKAAMAPVFSTIADIISKIAEWAAENPTLVATIIAIITTIGILIGIFMALAPIFVTLTGAAAALGISVGAVATPVLIVIGVIIALIAIGVALWKNWDTVKEKASQLGNKFPWLKEAFNALTNPIDTLIGWGDKLKGNWQDIQDRAGELKSKVANLFKGIKWELPKLKLPHFKASGKLDLNPFGGVSVPKITVDWYRNGGLFPANSPRLIGIGDHPTAEEAALPLTDEVYNKIAKGLSRFVGGSGQSAVIQIVTPDMRELARWMVDDISEFQQLSLARKRTFEGG